MYACHIAGTKGSYRQDIYSQVRLDTCLYPKCSYDLGVCEEKEPEKLGMRQEEWSSREFFFNIMQRKKGSGEMVLK